MFSRASHFQVHTWSTDSLFAAYGKWLMNHIVVLTVMCHCALTGCVCHRALQWHWQHTGNPVLCWASAERLEAACQTPGKEGIQVDSQEEEWLPEPPTSSWPSQTSAVSVVVCKHPVVKCKAWHRPVNFGSQRMGNALGFKELYSL